jgi:hypothetical protein
MGVGASSSLRHTCVAARRFEQLTDRAAAAKTYQELVAREELQKFAEVATAKERLARWRARCEEQVAFATLAVVAAVSCPATAQDVIHRPTAHAKAQKWSGSMNDL